MGKYRALEPRRQVEIHVRIIKEPKLPLGAVKVRRFRISATDNKAINASIDVRPSKNIRKIRDIEPSVSRRLRLQEHALVAGRRGHILGEGRDQEQDDELTGGGGEQDSVRDDVRGGEQDDA